MATYKVAGRPGAKMRVIAEVVDGQRRITPRCKAPLSVGQVVLMDSKARTYCRITEVEEITYGDGDYDVVQQAYLYEPCAAPVTA